MSVVTKKVSEYVKNKGINLSKLSRDTNIRYMDIYNSLANPKRNRDLKDYELIRICKFLGVNPMDFAEDEGRKKAWKI